MRTTRVFASWAWHCNIS